MIGRLQGRVALVSGSSRGIGAAIAKDLFAAGAQPIITYNSNKAAALDVAKQCGDALVLQLCVDDEDSVKQCVADILSRFGKLDILVNNAGILEQKPFFDITLAEWEETLKVNLTGPFLCTREVARVFQQQQSGCIINIASIGGQFGGPKAPHYAASKGALLTFTKSTARILAPYKVRVNAVAPGFIRTDMYEHMVKITPEEEILANIPLGYVGEPEDVGQAVVYLASDDARFITGEVINVNGGQLMGA